MRYLVLSDLHANLEAAVSMVTDARGQGFDRVVGLGDLVGYGGSPNEVIDLVRELEPAAQVRGNHDKAVAGVSEGNRFNDIARRAAMWTRGVLTPANLEYLRGLPRGPVDAGGFLIAHGSPLDEEEYILGEVDAEHAFEQGNFETAFFGHTHYACVFVRSSGRPKLQMLAGDRGTLWLEAGARYLINPGSIGQPRDHDPRASYAIFDTSQRSVHFRRVDYDLAGAQAKIRSAGLPEVLSQRLALGV